MTAVLVVLEGPTESLDWLTSAAAERGMRVHFPDARLSRGDSPPSPVRQALLDASLGRSALAYDPPLAVSRLRSALPGLRSPAARRWAAGHLALAHLGSGAISEGLEVLRAFDDDPVLLRCQQMLASMPGMPGCDLPSSLDPGLHAVAAFRSPLSAVEHASQALSCSSLLPVAPAVYACALLALVHADEVSLARCHIDDALEEASRHGWETARVELLAVRAQLALRMGDLDAAERDATASLSGEPVLSHGLGVLVDVLVARGQLAEAAKLLVRADLRGPLPVEWRYNHLLEARGRLRVARGDVRAGLDDFLECGRRLAESPTLSTWRSSAALALASPDLALEELELARASGSPRAVGIALRTAALLSVDPLPLLAESASLLELSPAVLEYGHTLVEYGIALREKGMLGEARETLRRALDVVQRCGATVLAERAHAELLRSGARPRRLAQSGREALTPAERRTAELAAAGRTNREIAEALFVTRRVIEGHLTSVYRKLAVTGRTALADALRLECRSG
ncbi:LuxR C-terminal-related transcriptional regulator [Allokutzneria sp. A3M-2-11 16]|uniref:LuxR family transcriptional regulator n=1 Tax=Allokutzneria sp. A3M-2-11 16 TaxID=2962043 RepID=UPI0020B8B37B|nr:LuxR family transcriptional regulator [Allokutzneria sp. A3M-2-11 16]MCP3805313.1 LuxR C-terminal-related transcriptional regulator [Allokutzneria sp. A3M-2-11 16]